MRTDTPHFGVQTITPPDASGGAICRQTRHYAFFIYKCLFGVSQVLFVPRSKLVRSEINQNIKRPN